jgi:hypothetical protein
VLRTILTTKLRFCAILALGALAACQAADGTTVAPDTAMVNAIMGGLGAVDPKAKKIQYKPRAPLAMPAEPTALPEPETNVAGTQSEAWPKNQNNQTLEEVKAVYAAKNTRGGGDGDENPVLTPEQMRGITVPTTQTRDFESERRQAEIDDGDLLNLKELKQQNDAAGENKKQANASSATAGVVPARRYLTDPPSTYSTPSPDAPMPEIVKTKKMSRERRNEIRCAGESKNTVDCE